MHVALVAAEFEENLSIRYLWSALESEGHRVSFIRFNGPEELESAAQALAGSGAGLAGVSMVFTSRAWEFTRMIARARELGFRGFLIAGGHFATLHAEQLLESVPELDAVGLGEGEGLLCDLAAHLDEPGGVRGLVWRDGAGLRRNAPREPQSELDNLVPPHHRRPFDQFLGLPMANLVGSRGCLHHCHFCSIAAWHRHGGGPRLRLRSPEALAQEMAELYHEGVRIFNFHDDNFILPRKEDSLRRFERLAKALEARGVGRIAFAIKARPDELDAEILGALKAMGLFRVFLGIEAGGSRALKQLGRTQTVAQNARALDLMRELDLHACYNLLLLNPDSSLEDLREQASFLREHPHVPMNFCRTEVHGGTSLEAQLRRQGRLQGDLWGLDYVIQDPRAEAAYEGIRQVFHRRTRALDCLQHRAMALDFELKLLERFYSPQPRLKRRIQDFVVRLNQDTAQRLVQIADAAEGAQDWSAMAAACDVADGAFRTEAAALMAQLRAAAQPCSASPGLPWLAAVSLLVLPSALPAQVVPQAPTVVASEKARFRAELGRRVAEGARPLVEDFLSGESPVLHILLDLNAEGMVSHWAVLTKVKFPDTAQLDLPRTRMLPDLSSLRCQELGGQRLVAVLRRDEFQKLTPTTEAPTVTLRPLPVAQGRVEVVAVSTSNTSIYEWAHSSPRDTPFFRMTHGQPVASRH